MFPNALEAAVGLGRIHEVKELLEYLFKNVPRERDSGSWQEMRGAARSIWTALRMAIRVDKKESAAELIKRFSDHDVFRKSLKIDFRDDLFRDGLNHENSE